MKDYNFIINGNEYSVSIGNIDEKTAEVMVNGASFNVEFDSKDKPKQKAEKLVQVAPKPDSAPAAKPAVAKPVAAASPASGIKSPLPGTILDILVKVGDQVKEGQHIMILEAMKMENNVDSNRTGVVKTIEVARGDSVLEGDVLITIE